MRQNRIYFRADGNAKMGLGHVIRSLALASMLKDNYECIFLIRHSLPVIKPHILEACHWLVELPVHKNELDEAQFIFQQYLQPRDIIVLDGYHFNTNYQTILKDSGAKVVCIDDIHAYHFVADAIINHAPGLKPDQYSTEEYTRLFFGLDYSLLRQPFLRAAQEQRSFQKIETAFICFGGSDFNNLTIKALQAVIQQQWIKKVHIVLGGAYKNKKDIENFISQHQVDTVKLHHNLSAEEMVDVMKDSHLAIVPASSILFEAAAIGMVIISGFYVDNQADVYRGFLELGMIRGVGDFNKIKDFTGVLSEVSSIQPKTVLSKQRENISGQAKANFLQLFNNLHSLEEPNIYCRKAQTGDLMLYFNWANEPGVRTQALSVDPIPIEDHQRWFNNKLNNDNCFLYIFFVGQVPLGQVRFDLLDHNKVTIDYALDVRMRGKGYGKKMLRLAIDTLKKESSTRITLMEGIVKKGNIPSKKIFEQLDFELIEEKVIQGGPCFVFRYKME